jgi:hypothetical protein
MPTEEDILQDGLHYFMLCLEEQEQKPKYKTAEYIVHKYNVGPFTALEYVHRIQVRYTFMR